MKWTLAPLVLAAFAAGSWLLARQPEPLQIPRQPNQNQSTEHQSLGAATCSAASCHGANGREGSKSSEYSTWADHDAHNRAYSVLFDKRSQQMARNLGLDKPAHESAVCLKCHGTLPADHLRGGRFQASDGVSCEGCHGPAQHWIAEHYLPGWKTLSAAQKEALGFQNTKNLLIRARQCVDCHVGKGDADVNHDLLAAGHPRLQFEFNAFLAAVPKHWSEQDEKARYPDFEARAWLIGQAVTAKASLDVLAERATKKTDRIWPEFAEYDCRSCHHDLDSIKARPAPKTGESYLHWNDWFSLLAMPSLTLWGDESDRNLDASVKDLRSEMEKPLPNTEETARAARKLADRLQRWTAGLDTASGENVAGYSKLYRQLQADDSLARRGNDSAIQRFLALRALHRTLSELTPKLVDPASKPTLQLPDPRMDLPESFKRLIEHEANLPAR